MKMRKRGVNEKCNCENGSCGHSEGCGKIAGDTFIDQIGYVCDECAKTYPGKYILK
jgi:hypothetical protein